MQYQHDIAQLSKEVRRKSLLQVLMSFLSSMTVEALGHANRSQSARQWSCTFHIKGIHSYCVWYQKLVYPRDPPKPTPYSNTQHHLLLFSFHQKTKRRRKSLVHPSKYDLQSGRSGLCHCVLASVFIAPERGVNTQEQSATCSSKEPYH